MKHELKILPTYYRKVVAMNKRAEIRRDDGRNFKLWDRLKLREWDPVAKAYTGRFCEAIVTHIDTIRIGKIEKFCIMSLGMIVQKAKRIS